MTKNKIYKSHDAFSYRNSKEVLLLLVLFVAFVCCETASAQVLTGYDGIEAKPLNSSETIAVASAVAQPEEKEEDTSNSPLSGKSNKEPVDLQADHLVHDDQNQIIAASGNVMLVQAGRILRADEISYDLRNDVVVASGHVVLNEENGDIHYADEVKLNDRLKSGFVKGLQTFLMDGSRFTAKGGERKDGVTTVMSDATYTPCEPCKEDPEKPPVWQIRAGEVKHDSEAHEISYNDATFEILGVPVAYTPYFAHPDGTIKQKSGFLTPSAGYQSELGAFVSNSYYWAIGPDKDATVGVKVMTEEVPLGFAEYRQRWGNASLELDGSVTHSKRTRRESGIDVVQDEELRGHLFGKGLWDINDKWRAGTNLELTSDDQFLNQYDISGEDILENEIFAERFSGRDYGVVRALTFQDLRIREDEVDQPDVLPELITSFLGEPGSVPVIGGRWSVDASVLGLRRSGDDQDLNRLSGDLGWQRRLVSDTGLLTTVDTSVRGDVYNVRDRDVATPGSGQSGQSSESRAFPQLHVQSSYPVVKSFEKFQATVEPIVALTAAINLDVNDAIPNEDSQDSQIDASNVFEPNRFPGLDRIEDKSRVTYGVRSGLYGYDGSHADVFVGQSYRLDDDDNPFPEGSGLNNQESDVVGQVSGLYKDNYGVNYRFQLASDNLASQRHEIDAYANWDRFQIGSRYLFAKGLGGTDIEESREQIQESVSYYVTESWRLNGGATHDLGDESGLRTAYVGLDYLGQCISWSIQGERNLTDDSSGDSDTEILFRIGLKNLGEFEASGLRVNSSDE